MAIKTGKTSKVILWVVGGVVVLCLFACLGFYLLGKIAESDPSVQATGTAQVVGRLTKTAESKALSLQNTLTANAPTPSVTASPTIDPFFTPPTPTMTATSTVTATVTFTPTKTPLPTNTLTPTKTPIPSRTPTATLSPTPIPPIAGVSDWITYDDKLIGVREIVFSNYLGYYRPETGKIFVSLYVVAINNSTQEYSFLESDLGLVDGGGEITSGVYFAEKEPSFSSCTIKPGGACEGWWTTMIWDRPEVKNNLNFRWDPCLLLCPAMETPIRQNQ